MLGIGYTECFILFFPLLNLALALWVGRDARRRGDNGPVWAVGVLVTSILGLVLYLLWRRMTQDAERALEHPAIRGVAEASPAASGRESGSALTIL